MEFGTLHPERRQSSVSGDNKSAMDTRPELNTTTLYFYAYPLVRCQLRLKTCCTPCRFMPAPRHSISSRRALRPSRCGAAMKLSSRYVIWTSPSPQRDVQTTTMPCCAHARASSSAGEGMLPLPNTSMTRPRTPVSCQCGCRLAAALGRAATRSNQGVIRGSARSKGCPHLFWRSAELAYSLTQSNCVP